MKRYHFTETEDIKRYLIEIEAAKIIFDNLKILSKTEEKIRRESLLKSSLYSARIEGNPLTWKDLKDKEQEKIKKLEVSNLLAAYRNIYLENFEQDRIKTKLIKELHKKTMRNIAPGTGKYRQEAWAIFNEAGVAIYLAPAFFEVPKLMEEYVDYINQLTFHPCINAAIAQFILEKIHPFADGNGRTGRLVSALVLRKNNYHMRGMMPFEEYTDKHRELYYYALEPSRDMTEFIEYFLKSLSATTKEIIRKLSAKQTLSEKRGIKKTENLSPRRQEIVNIIGDHPDCSFDFLRRRFEGINEKTLHYDLKKLQEKRLIRKLGNTRGAVYCTDDKIACD